ncbi:helix-turn-helix domain-containing protein [[Brevibacterium] frigoritolerans]|uniref:Helix-turn-helix domain-containing protein n=1 Tax=Peribacillus frigoritolerans TaxID=450367 RepID=A0A941FS92_9BACI|nr:helix-turn-helix domain-containing protein [Peribacillus frigoritolerans]
MNDGVDIPQISQAVYISRSTAYRHLEKLQEVVSEAGVTLTASPFKVIGDEKRLEDSSRDIWTLCPLKPIPLKMIQSIR